MDAFDEPALFCRRLADLLEFYADRTYRAGQIGAHPPLIPYYQVPLPVLRQVDGALSMRGEADPPAALRVADALWAEEALEPKQMAIHLLGTLPVATPEPLIERLRAWTNPELEPRLRDELLTRGGARLMIEKPALWLDLAGEWLGSSRPLVQAMGLRALIPVISDARFENLPSIFRLLAPIVQSARAELQVDLVALIEILARRSPLETAYFLRQSLAAVNLPGVRRVVRRCLPSFPPDVQRSLRDALQRPV